MVSKDEVSAICRLARLTIAPEDLDRLTGECNSILEYVRQLEHVDVAGIEAMSHVHGVTNVLRPDEEVATLTTEAALRNAPDLSGTLIRVPIIIDSESES